MITFVSGQADTLLEVSDPSACLGQDEYPFLGRLPPCRFM